MYQEDAKGKTFVNPLTFYGDCRPLGFSCGSCEKRNCSFKNHVSVLTDFMCDHSKERSNRRFLPLFQVRFFCITNTKGVVEFMAYIGFISLVVYVISIFFESALCCLCSDQATRWTVRGFNSGKGKRFSVQNIQASSGDHPSVGTGILSSG
jgi:hypothetical protein